METNEEGATYYARKMNTKLNFSKAEGTFKNK